MSGWKVGGSRKTVSSDNVGGKTADASPSFHAIWCEAAICADESEICPCAQRDVAEATSVMATSIFTVLIYAKFIGTGKHLPLRNSQWLISFSFFGSARRIAAGLLK